MDNYTIPHFTWGNFITVAIVLIATYFILRFIKIMLDKADFLGAFQSNVKRIVNSILLVYELIVILILGASFILIHPVFNGLLLGFMAVVAFPHIRKYLSGRIIQFDNVVKIGKRLSFQNKTGQIADTGRLGIKLRTTKGLHFIDYSRLLNEGFTILSGEEVSGLYQLEIAHKAPEERKNYRIILHDLLASAPYIDWTQKPQIVQSNSNPNQFKASVTVKDDNQLHELISLIQERGFSCKLSKK